MGEFVESMLSGGGEAPLEHHPAIKKVVDMPYGAWVLYLIEETVREFFFRALEGPYDLHIWALLEGLGGPGKDVLGEREARLLASLIAGQQGAGRLLGRAIADGIIAAANKVKAAKHQAAYQALVEMARAYRP